MKKYYLLLFLVFSLQQIFAQSCVDSSRIDLSAPCPLVFIPTCGCDSVGYGNPCEALTYGGVTSYRIGVCGSDSNCSANFNIAIQTDTVVISNISSSIDSISWCHFEFGNGDTSNLVNPVYTYHSLLDSTFVVCLTIQSLSGCTSQFCRFIKVQTLQPDTCIVNFSFVDSFDVFQFYDSSLINVGSTIFYRWNFDDGATANVANPIHTYSTPGLYSPCLSIIVVNGLDTCIQTICKVVNVSMPPCINLSLIDTSKYCPNVNPVCGCDSITYTNACYAQYHHGVRSWRSGNCLTGINTIEEWGNSSILFPNPTSKLFFVQSEFSKELIISIFDITGNVCKSQQILTKDGLDVSMLQNGVYLVKLEIDSYTFYKKLFKN